MRWEFVLFAFSVLACPIPPVEAGQLYTGKTIKIIVASPAGAGHDRYARVVANHLAKHIPGHPYVLVYNMPGAGGRIGAAFVANQGPKDGTVIAALPTTAVLAPLYFRETAGYDARSFIPLGSVDVGTRVCVMTVRSGIRTYEDLFVRDARVGSTGLGSSMDMYSYMLRNLTGARLRVVLGYDGTPAIFLAMERGEIDGVCGIEWVSVVAQRPDWFVTGYATVILQTGPIAHAALPGFGPVPDMRSYIRELDVAELLVKELAFSRFYATPSGVPNETVALLRRAFNATLADPEFIADARRNSLNITPVSGEHVEELLRDVLMASPALLDRLRSAQHGD